MVYKLKYIVPLGLIIALISWAAFAAWPSSGSYPANVFYWAAAGNDSNNCRSPATACQTITHFNAFSFNKGATVKFKGGDTFSGGLTNFATNMTVTSYGTGQPTISSGNSTACVTVTNLAGVKINNLNCVGGGNASNTTSGIYFHNTNASTTLQAATITNNTVTGYGHFGILVQGEAVHAGYNNVLVNNNTVHDNTGNNTSTDFNTCIAVGTTADFATFRVDHTNVTVSNNLIYNCQGTAAAANGSGSGILVNGTTTGLISNNVIHDYGANNTHCGGPGGIEIQDDDSVIVQFNEVYNGNRGTGGACDGEALDIDNDVINSVMQYNYVHDMLTADGDILICGCAAVSALAFNNNTYRFNIVVNTVGAHPSVIVNAGHAGLFQPITNMFVYNNTFFNAGNQVLNTGAGQGSPTTTDWTGEVSNNILDTTAGTTVTTVGLNPNVLFAGNLYYNAGTFSVSWNGTSYNSLGGFQTGTGQEKVGGNPVGLNTNPNLLNAGTSIVGGYSPPLPVGYHPQAGAPILPNAGLNLTTNFSINPGTQDFYGNAVTAATLPIGAASAVFPGGGTSSITLVRHGGGGNCAAGCNFNTGAAVTGTTAGNFLVIGLFWCGDGSCASSAAQTISSVTTSQGDTCLQVPKVAVINNDVGSDIWYCPNIVGGTEQVTCSSTATVFFLACPVVELHGVSATRPIDSVTRSFSNVQLATSYSLATGDATVNANEFVYSMGSIAGNPVVTMGQTPLNNGFDEYQFSGVAGAVYFNTATWAGGGQRYSVGLAAFE